MVEPDKIAEVLGVDAKTLRDLIHEVEQGLPKQALRRTAERVFTDRGEIRRFMSNVVPEATLKRRRERLSVDESERTERVARVIAAAEYAWEDRQAAREWLNTPHPELNNRSPLQAAFTELGARQVEMVLERIGYGLPA